MYIGSLQGVEIPASPSRKHGKRCALSGKEDERGVRHRKSPLFPTTKKKQEPEAAPVFSHPLFGSMIVPANAA